MQYSSLITSALFLLSLSSSLAFTIPSSWDALKLELDKDIQPQLTTTTSTCRLSAKDENYGATSLALDPSLPVFYRDKNCICAACESVWLALETKCVQYNTVLVDIDSNDSNSNDDVTITIPRITWPADDTSTNNNNNNNDDDATTINKNTACNDPIQLLEQIQKRYPDNPPNFYPSLSSAVDASRCNILRLPGVMPRNSDPALQSLAPHLFRADGTRVKQSSHAVTLEEIEEMQEEYYLGDFLCGRDITAADMIWGPYLERYAVQLPLVFPNKGRLNPRNRNVYQEVDNWYKVMEEGSSVPEYVCRVMGDERHWRECLEVAVEIHNDRVENEEERVSLVEVSEERGWWMKKMKKRFGNDVDKIWNEYSSKRSWVASTPGGEVSLFLLRNREMIVDSAVAAQGEEFGDNDSADEALREVAQVLMEWDSTEESTNQTLSERGLKMALFVAEEIIHVPRDIGMIPSSVLWDAIWSSDAKEGESANVEEQTKVAMS